MLPEEENKEPESNFEYREIVQTKESKDLMKKQIREGEKYFNDVDKDFQKRLKELK